MDLPDVRASFAADLGSDGEERIVSWRGAIEVQPQHGTTQMLIVRCRTAELVVRHGSRRWAEVLVGWPASEILQMPTPAQIADEDVQLSIRPDAQHTAIVITALRLPRVLLDGAQPDEIHVGGEGRAVPHEPIDAIAEERCFAEDVGVYSGRTLRPEEKHVRR